MRRSMTVLAVVGGLLGAMFVESASARTPRVRWDPNDSTSSQDIRKVSTDTTPNRVVLWIGLWGRTRPREGRALGWIVVPMNTHGSSSTDRYVYIKRHRCFVQEKRAGDYRHIGRRHVRLRGKRSIGCKLPLDWFDIKKRVRFAVVVVDGSGDRAPNKGFYVGL